jgi:class 3 adenylate cyclase/CHASE3 domain sensor protein
MPDRQAHQAVHDSDREATNGSHAGGVHGPILPVPLRPFVNAVARVKASIHLKLLAGFLVGALLLLTMGLLSVLVIQRMDRRVDDMTALQRREDLSRQLIYQVTAQSHYRAMALLTQSDLWNDRISTAKEQFAAGLDDLERDASDEDAQLIALMRQTRDRFDESSSRVSALYQSGDVAGALNAHLVDEHEISHQLEAQLNQLIDRSVGRVTDATADFDSDRQALTLATGTFSGVSLVSALFLGLVLSWAFVWPVRRIGHVLERVAAGDFSGRVDVSNRDEFGTLGRNLNHMSGQLGTLYAELQALNATLQHRVDEQVEELERAMTLRRYLPPQVADSILSGDSSATLSSRRRNLTIFFSDVRGFTELSERLEPEELVEMLNQYLTEMTDIVFKYGGTLDKYIGDAIMVFFGDPIEYDDHAERAVRMALEMRTRLGELQREWLVGHDEQLTIGMGITTGYVTVGNVGSAARAEYTVIGNHVNLASRLADQANAGEILVSEKTMVAARHIVSGTEVEQIQLSGVTRPIRIYSISENAQEG